MCKVNDIVEDHDFNARVAEIFERKNDVNRLILVGVGKGQWRVTLVDSNRPNDLSEIKEKIAGMVYEIDETNKLEYITAYTIYSDDFGRVVYRIS
ncbi:hypothetical protein [Chromobacterium subtsugae]|uniref:hypothetical protein n=1 Tax=Chromobacterium subtsugae TaxID=251747 RepID=UPI000A6A5D2C|nr:hypothetical protein [Chromobacterium subtsugae]